MTRSAQIIFYSVRSPFAMHSHCAYQSISAQYFNIYVRFIKPMHKVCAINQVFAQKSELLCHCEKQENYATRKTACPFQVHLA